MFDRTGRKCRHTVPRAGRDCCRAGETSAGAALELSRRGLMGGMAASVAGSALSDFARAQSAGGSDAGRKIVFTNAKLFDGRAPALKGGISVLVEGDRIADIVEGAVKAPDGARVIDCGGRTLMPGLIDAHTHIMFASLAQATLLTSDFSYVAIAAAREAEATLMRGFTSIRDVGGPCFGLKKAIDQGLVPGPRIWPSGAMISQSGGHGDFRLPTELPAAPGAFDYTERIGASAIADDEATVRRRVREQLALGASQIKLMAGGGVASSFDPLDVTQYSAPEIRAAVEAAENWGTYVTVHAYSPRAVQQSIAAGVKCIDHGNMLDDATARLIADKGLWWSLQPFTDDKPSAFADGTPNRLKQLTMFGGTDTAYALAKKYKIRTAWGTDGLFSAETAAAQGRMLAKMVRWYSPAEALRMATADNADLLAMSGPRNPYPAKVGVIEKGAHADLLVLDGDPLADLSIVADHEKRLKVIMKGGRVWKEVG